MSCAQCELLETIRGDRIKRLLELIERRKRDRDHYEELLTKINAVVIEFSEASRRLNEHRKTHEAAVA